MKSMEIFNPCRDNCIARISSVACSTRSSGTKLIFYSDYGSQIFQLRLHEAALVTGRQMPYRRNPKQILLMNDNHTWSKLCCIDQVSPFLPSLFSTCSVSTKYACVTVQISKFVKQPTREDQRLHCRRSEINRQVVRLKQQIRAVRVFARPATSDRGFCQK